MSRAVALGAAALAAGLGATSAGCGREAEHSQPAKGLRAPGTRPVQGGRHVPRPELADWHGPLGARLIRPALLRTRPSGDVVARLGTRTWFGTTRILAVARRRQGWVAVRAVQMPNHHVGWVPADAVRLVAIPIVVDIDLSKRRLTVREGSHVVQRTTVAIGRASNPTPTGHYGVTDRLLAGHGSGYGCCVLALTGHQDRLPVGWTGGTRLAIHGTPQEASIGQAASSGCVRVSDAPMRRLLRTVPVGTTVEIHT